MVQIIGPTGLICVRYFAVRETFGISFNHVNHGDLVFFWGTSVVLEALLTALKVDVLILSVYVEGSHFIFV